jgi:phosphatidylglycerophosphatase A
VSGARHKLGYRDGADWQVLLVCGFGSGFAPKAPGTFGSALAVVVWWFLLAPLAPWLQLLVAVLAYVLGSVLVARVQQRYGVVDDGAIVVDEFVGQWLALLAAPAAWLPVLLGFGLFRLFDIWKPGPVRMLERRLGGAAGVMADDVLAGLMAAAVLQITLLALGGA